MTSYRRRLEALSAQAAPEPEPPPRIDLIIDGQKLAAAVGRASEQFRGGRAVDATDAARLLARQRGVPLVAVKGSGKNGRVTKADVEAHTAAGEADS